MDVDAGGGAAAGGDVELRQLRSFLAVADDLSFTRAAERLRVDQPTLSRRVRRLERALGVDLFTRSSRRVALTVAGERLRERTAALLAGLDATLAELRGGPAVRPGRLRLGRPGWLADPLVNRLVRLVEADGAATVDLHCFELGDPSAGLASGAVDAAVVVPPLGTPGLSFVTLLREPRMLLVARAHPLARRASVALAELDALDLPWGVPPGTDPVWQAYWAAADVPGRTLPPRRVEFTDRYAYRRAVAAGQVVGLGLADARGAGAAGPDVAAVAVRGLDPAAVAVGWRTGDPNPLLPTLAAAARALARP